MDTTAPGSPSRADDRPSLIARVIGTLTAATALVGATLYLAGNVSYSNRLHDLGVPPDLFPQSVEATMVSGYYAIVGRWAAALLSPWLWTAIALALLFTSAWAFAGRLGEARRAAKGSDTSTEAIPRAWWKLALTDVGKTFLVIAAGVYAMLLLTLVVVLPGYMGELEGQDRAASIRTCAERSAASGHARAELLLEGDIVARGFVIAASAEHIALYDIDSKSVRTLDRPGLELRSRPAKRADKKPGEGGKTPVADTCW